MKEKQSLHLYLNIDTSELKAAFHDVKANEHFTVPYTITGYNEFLSKEGYPAIAPPWALLQCN